MLATAQISPPLALWTSLHCHICLLASLLPVIVMHPRIECLLTCVRHARHVDSDNVDGRFKRLKLFQPTVLQLAWRIQVLCMQFMTGMIMIITCSTYIENTCNRDSPQDANGEKETLLHTDAANTLLTNILECRGERDNPAHSCS
jgi:hypothetical protein